MKQRSAKKVQKWKERFERERQLRQEIRAVAPDILRSKNFRSTRSHVQHGNMTVNDHSMNVATYSLAISEKLHIPGEKKDLIRGALSHDYFLYDWHTPDHISPHKLHGFYHPGRALHNAQKEYHLTPREKDIIKKHMWPLTISAVPMCREAWIVTMADKWCSLMETFHVHKGRGALIEKLRKIEEEQGK